MAQTYTHIFYINSQIPIMKNANVTETDVVILMKFSSLAAAEFVKMTISIHPKHVWPLFKYV